MNLENKEVEFRGRILALSLKIEDSLNRILYNFFAQRSKDDDTKSIFLQNFILPLTFGQKINLYKQVLKTGRYQGKVMAKLKTVENFPVSDLSNFYKVIQENLAEIIYTRNYVAHGTEITKSFLTLSDDEVVFMKKADFMKMSNESIEKFSLLVKDTYVMLDITDGDLIDKE
ncbi:hypothetical protein [Flavobacterium hibisci]|uniref:hypothetical protein n=1 Tax=Flavobacterium hibisci TaxID=1914462 RepID=UPI001CC04B5E|nr:hypothetical protein [Flavobacterium hibisci]MBZ4042859.1 hypothetical protein [Flavobacterium hibisci]